MDFLFWLLGNKPAHKRHWFLEKFIVRLYSSSIPLHNYVSQAMTIVFGGGVNLDWKWGGKRVGSRAVPPPALCSQKVIYFCHGWMNIVGNNNNIIGNKCRFSAVFQLSRSASSFSYLSSCSSSNNSKTESSVLHSRRWSLWFTLQRKWDTDNCNRGSNMLYFQTHFPVQKNLFYKHTLHDKSIYSILQFMVSTKTKKIKQLLFSQNYKWAEMFLNNA